MIANQTDHKFKILYDGTTISTIQCNICCTKFVVDLNNNEILGRFPDFMFDCKHMQVLMVLNT